MNIRKPVDYGTMYRELTAILTQNLPQMDEVYAIGKGISQRPEKGAAVAAAEYLQANFPDRVGFSPRNVRRMRDFYKTYENDQALLQLAMKIGWTLNVLIMEAKLSRLQKRFYIYKAMTEKLSKKLLEMEITDKKRTVDDSGAMCYNHYVSLQNYHERIEHVMPMTVNIAGQVRQIRLSTAKALWPLFETVINSIQSLEDTNIDEKKIVIEALRSEDIQLKTDGSGGTVEELTHYISFNVTDNGNGFNTENYHSFTEAYSQLKEKKGCKGIGRFLWLKAFEEADVDSVYYENGQWWHRAFKFTLNGVNPEQNCTLIDAKDVTQKTTVSLKAFKYEYRNAVPYALESLARKLIEHCLPYFITGTAPQIILKDNRGSEYHLNEYYETTYKDSLNQDHLEIRGEKYILYHMLLSEGADKHELHLCANNREVKSYALSTYIPDMKKKLSDGENSFYYIGYLAGDYLDKAVNMERSDFDFADGPLLGEATEAEVVDSAVGHVRLYLQKDLQKVADEKRKQIDMLVKTRKPQYRLLLNRKPEVYDKIPAGMSDEKLDLELYRHQQQWEFDTAKKGHDIEERAKKAATDDPDFQKLFDDYCESITELSRASLAEYVVHRKAVIDLFERALETGTDGKYRLESRIHSIICPMQATSDDTALDNLNLWLIDDRLAYHHYLASDKKIESIPLLENNTKKRMDLAVFDAALSYTADPENISSITIVELKRPQRDDGDNDPILQVLKYVKDIKDGKIRKTNGRGLGDVRRVSFYCYVIGDMTQSMRESAESRSLTATQDNEGYFGYNPTYGAYIEVISYDKLLKNAKQRNRALFDKLFAPKASDLKHPENLQNS